MKKSLEFEVYQTPSGKPACSLDINAKKYCKFLGIRKFGTEEICLFPTSEKSETPLFRDKDGVGYLIPCESCPLHQKL